MLTENELFRLLEIDLAIRCDRRPTVEDLATALRVSTRTIERDLDHLQVVLGAPIHRESFRGGFVYGPGWTRVPGELRATFNCGEVAA